mmetsp:Transcript_127364/g.407683  ORF Transcript_127364/g.407683 Transcript_127364/m.407683 type:complete len:210 (+) Transcript_127364:3069-3698(+)
MTSCTRPNSTFSKDDGSGSARCFPSVPISFKHRAMKRASRSEGMTSFGSLMPSDRKMLRTTRATFNILARTSSRFSIDANCKIGPCIVSSSNSRLPKARESIFPSYDKDVCPMSPICTVTPPSLGRGGNSADIFFSVCCTKGCPKPDQDACIWVRPIPSAFITASFTSMSTCAKGGTESDKSPTCARASPNSSFATEPPNDANNVLEPP